MAKFANRKTIYVTAEDGVTGRTWFGVDPDGNNGALGRVNAKNVKVANTDGANNARYQLNHRTGDLSATNSDVIDATKTDRNDEGDFQCISYAGIGGDVSLRITIEW